MPRAPGPHARVLGGCALAVQWSGAEGESVPDPVTPGVLWLGGARGGSRCEGLTHQPAGVCNGGDVAHGRGAMALRDTTLEAIERSYASQKAVHEAPYRIKTALPPAPPTEKAKLDPSWRDPLEVAGGDRSKMRPVTFHDVVQGILRTKEEDTYGSPPEKPMHRQLVMDLLTCPWVFPFYSRVLANCPSARKFYYRVLSPDFTFRVPGFGRERLLSKAEFFRLIFEELLPSFPDLSFNASFLTTTGLDDCSHVEVAVTGTHTGAPFAPMGLPALPALGRRVALPAEFLRLRFGDLQVTSAAADPLPAGQEAMGFPTGIYLQLGGDLPGF